MRGVRAILGRELPKLLKGIHQGQRVLADEMQFVPHLVESGFLVVIQHQLHERFILAIEERQSDHLIDRHNLGVTERGGKNLAKLRESRFKPLARGAVFIHHNRDTAQERGHWRTRFVGQHLKLHAAFRA